MVSFLWQGNKINVFFSTKTIEKLKIYRRNKNPQSHGPIITIISILADYLLGFNFLGQCVLSKAIIIIYNYFHILFLYL